MANNPTQVTFWKPATAGISLLVMLGCLLGWQLSQVEQVDIKAYQQLVASSDPSAWEWEPAPHTCTQQQQFPTKDIYINKNGSRLHSHLTGESAELVLIVSGNNSEAVEHLRTVSCDMQEQIRTEESLPMQVVRRLEADTATYYYNKDLLSAEHVQLERFVCPGGDLSDLCEDRKKLMEGTAKSLQCSLGGDEKGMKAYHLNAKIYSSGGAPWHAIE